MAGAARGNITIDVEECKGCGLCVESCPPKCLELAPELSSYGVHPARYTGHDCTGCGICFYCCPEPGGRLPSYPAPQGRCLASTARRRTCGNCVKETLRSLRAQSWPGAVRIMAT